MSLRVEKAEDRQLPHEEQRTLVKPSSKFEIIEVLTRQGIFEQVMIRNYPGGFAVSYRFPRGFDSIGEAVDEDEALPEPRPMPNSVFQDQDGRFVIEGEDVFAIELRTADIKQGEELTMKIGSPVELVTVSGNGQVSLEMEKKGKIDRMVFKGEAKVSTPDGTLETNIRYTEAGRHATLNDVLVSEIPGATVIVPNQPEEPDEPVVDRSAYYASLRGTTVIAPSNVANFRIPNLKEILGHDDLDAGFGDLRGFKGTVDVRSIIEILRGEGTHVLPIDVSKTTDLVWVGPDTQKTVRNTNKQQ